MSIRTLSILSAIGLAVALPASAAGVQTEKLEVDHATLETERGLESTYEALKASAESVCDASDLPLSLERFVRSDDCVSEALDKAVGDINHPSLSALHDTAQSR